MRKRFSSKRKGEKMVRIYGVEGWEKWVLGKMKAKSEASVVLYPLDVLTSLPP
jgi:hypothetical protein